MATISERKQKVPVVEKKKRVAAYARVSITTEQLMHSLSAQISYYSSLIQKNPKWEYAGVYADEGISGTSIGGRKAFTDLIRDCEEGKVDIVLVKSISRFARNTVDLLNTVRHLKEIGVEVRFERENISTFSGDGELMLTLLASFAQEESESISRNEKWAIQKKFENGDPNTSLRCFGYDWDSDAGCCVINEAEAVWVRYIYDRYLGGASIKAIAREMSEKGVKGVRGEPLGRTTIRRILSNELYVGDVILQKYYSPFVRKPRLNRGEAPKYMVSDAHRGIVDRKDFKAVQDRIKERAERADNHEYTPHCFAGMVRCGKCGSACNYVGGRKNAENNNIECRQRKTKHCDLLPIREYELMKAMEKNINDREELDEIVLFDDHMELRLKKGITRKIMREYPSGRYDCFSRKIICGGCGKTFVRAAKKTGRVIWICNTRKLDRDSCSVQILPENELIEAACDILGNGNYKIEFYNKIEKVEVYNDRLDFIFKEGRVETWQRK